MTEPRLSSFFIFGSSGAAAGAGLSATLGNIGLVGSFGGVGLGTLPVAAAGVVASSAAYGAIDALTEGDTTAWGAAGLGAIGGIGVSSAIGGIGVSGSDRHVKLWNTATGNCLATLAGTHPVAFATDGSLLVTGSRNQVLKLWQQIAAFDNSDLTRCWWQVLGVSPDATPETVKAAHRRLAQRYHPDVNGDRGAIERMKLINQAYAAFLQTLENRYRYRT